MFENATKTCIALNLSLVDRSWVTSSTSKAAVSFQFQDKKDSSFVRNENGHSVGRVLGSGAAITINYPDTVKSMELCIAVEEASNLNEFPVWDYGSSDSSLSVVRPLGLENVTLTWLLDVPFLCGQISYQSLPLLEVDEGISRKVILFPIETVRNPDSYDPQYLDSSTEALVYTLAALFLLNFLCLFLFLFNMTREVITRGIAIPVVAYIAFILTILCVFRICFMFIYAAGEFDDNPLAEFVVFEIPTFLLFTTVILSLGFWRKLVSQKAYSSYGSNKLAFSVGLGILLVWLLFAVIVIIYAEAILTKEQESPCPGRVAPSTDKIDDSTRILFIVYQVFDQPSYL